MAFYILCSSSFCQDIIYLNNGDSVTCKIVKLDTGKIYINLIKEDREISTYVDRNNIREYKTDVVIRPKAELNYKGNLFCLAIDPFNFIFSGPTVTGELTLQGKDAFIGFGILSGYRIVKWGWMARDLLWDDLLVSSYTVPLGIRIYTNTWDKTEGRFIGPYMEFGKLRYDGREDELIRAYGVEYGFKIISSSSLTFEMSVILGKLKYGTPGDWITMFYPAASIKLGITL